VSLQTLREDEEREIAYCRHQLLEPHYNSLLEQLFPERHIIDAHSHSKVDCWSSETHVWAFLFKLLPFGTLLPQHKYDALMDKTLDDILYQLCQQLLYWHLKQRLISGEPVSNLTLTEEEDYLWRTHILPCTLSYQQDLLKGRCLRFLTTYQLTHEEVHLTFAEVKLVSQSTCQGTVYHFVQADGREYTYKWNNLIWDVTLDNSDPRTIDPTSIYVPSPLIGTTPALNRPRSPPN
jgi:hypothetical protein